VLGGGESEERWEGGGDSYTYRGLRDGREIGMGKYVILSVKGVGALGKWGSHPIGEKRLEIPDKKKSEDV